VSDRSGYRTPPPFDRHPRSLICRDLNGNLAEFQTLGQPRPFPDVVGSGWSRVAFEPAPCTRWEEDAVRIWMGIAEDGYVETRPNGYPAGIGLGATRRELHALDPLRYRNGKSAPPYQNTVRGWIIRGLAKKLLAFRTHYLPGYQGTLQEIILELERNNIFADSV